MQTYWLAVLLLLGLLLGVWFMLIAHGIRRRRGLGDGNTISLDQVTLTSTRLGLTGRPDRRAIAP